MGGIGRKFPGGSNLMQGGGYSTGLHCYQVATHACRSKVNDILLGLQNDGMGIQDMGMEFISLPFIIGEYMAMPLNLRTPAESTQPPPLRDRCVHVCVCVCVHVYKKDSDCCYIISMNTHSIR